MNNELPKIKKSLKTFISSEDAKVINKTSIKIALTSSFIFLNFLSNVENVSAKGHKNHNNHTNHIFVGDKEVLDNTINTSNKNVVIHYKNDLLNYDDKEKEVELKVDSAHIKNIKVPEKSVSSAHGNHYNHINGKGSS